MDFIAFTLLFGHQEGHVACKTRCHPSKMARVYFGM